MKSCTLQTSTRADEPRIDDRDDVTGLDDQLVFPSSGGSHRRHRIGLDLESNQVEFAESSGKLLERRSMEGVQFTTIRCDRVEVPRTHRGLFQSLS